jgi:Uma2 family endonuclease
MARRRRAPVQAKPLPRMTADEFIEWAMALPDGKRYELVGGEAVAMSPERAVHTRTKARAYRALDDAVSRAGLRCEAFADGMSVQIDGDTVYEPDALVRCGEPVHGDTVKISDPVIVVEVISPSSRGYDTGAKLQDYFRLASVRHYLVADASKRAVVHHRRDDDGAIRTHIVRAGTLELDPPGIELALGDLFAWRP